MSVGRAAVAGMQCNAMQCLGDERLPKVSAFSAIKVMRLCGSAIIIWGQRHCLLPRFKFSRLGHGFCSSQSTYPKVHHCLVSGADDVL